MTNQQRKISYGIDFEVNDAKLKRLKKQLEQLQKLSLVNYASQQGISLNNPAIAETQAHRLEQLKKDAAEFSRLMRLAYNPKTNSYNITKFNAALEQSGLKVKSFRAEMQKTAEGRAAWAAQTHELTKFNTEIKQSHKLLDSLGTTLANTIKWTISSSLMQGVTRSISQAYGFAKNLDSALNDIRIVTGKSADEMAKFAERANAVASNLGKGTNDYTRAALIYAQQGLGQKEIEEKTAITLKTANVTGQSAEEVSEELTAVWNGYKASAAQAEVYVDRLAAVASTTASNLQELSTGMSKVASAAAALGVGEDQLAAQLSTIISVTRQAPETVGTALRTVYARITDIQAGLDEDGVTLGKYSGDMAKVGINVLDLNDNLRNMGEVMEEIGNKWSTMTQEQKIYLAQTMAGQRQYSNLMALFDNFDKYESALNTAQNAEGKLQEQQDTYMNRLSAHVQQLTTATEHMWMGLVDTDGFKGVIDGLTTIVEKVDKLFQSIGGGKNLLQSLIPIVMSLTSKTVASGINTMIMNSQLEKRQLRDQKSSQALAQNEMKALQSEGQQGSQRYQVLKQKSEFLQAAPGTFSTQQMDEINKRWSGSLEAADEADKIKTELNQYSDITQSITTALGDNPVELKKISSVEDLETAITDVSGQYNELSKKIEQYARDQDAINKKQDVARQKLIEAYSQTSTQIASEKNNSQFKQFNLKNLRKYESAQAKIISQEQQKLNSLPALSNEKEHMIDTAALTGMFYIRQDNLKKGGKPKQISSIEKVKGFEEVKDIKSRKGKIEKIREIFKNSIYEEIYKQMPSSKTNTEFQEAVRNRFRGIEQDAKKAIQQASNKQKAANQELLRRQQMTNTYQQNFQALKGNLQIQNVDKFQNNLQFLSQNFSSIVIPPELKTQLKDTKKEYQELSQAIIDYNQKIQSSSKLSQEQIDTLKKEKKALEQKQQALLDNSQGVVDNINEEVQHRGNKAIKGLKDSRSVGKNNDEAIRDIEADVNRQKHLEGIMSILTGVNMLTAAYSNLGNAIRQAFYEGNWEGFVGAILTSTPMLISSLTQISNGWKKISSLMDIQIGKSAKVVAAKAAEATSSAAAEAANAAEAATKQASAKAAEHQAAANREAAAGDIAQGETSDINAEKNARQAEKKSSSGIFKSIGGALGGAGYIVMAIMAVIAVLKTVGDIVKTVAEEQIKANEKIIEQQKQKQDQIKHNQDIISEVEALNQQYKEGIITRQELKEKTQELQEKYKDESTEIRNLISDYNNLEYAAKKAKETQLEKGIESKTKETKVLGQNIDYKLTGQMKTQDPILGGFFTSGFTGLTNRALGNATIATGVGGNEATFAKKTGNLLEGVGLGRYVVDQYGSHIVLPNAQNEKEARIQIERLQWAVDNASEEDKQTQTYRNIQALLEEMSPMLQEWKTANQQKLGLIAQQQANKYSTNFEYVNSLEEYETKYFEVFSKIQKKLEEDEYYQGKTADEKYDEVSKAVEAIIPKDLKDNYGGDRIEAINRAKLSVEGIDNETISLINSLDEKQLAEFLKIPTKAYQDLNNLKRILGDINSFQYKNLEFNTADAKAAAQTYNNMANALQKIQNGKAISEKDFKDLGFTDEIKEYFRPGNNGQVLKDASKTDEVEKLIKQQQRSGWDENYRVQKNILTSEQNWLEILEKEGFNEEQFTKSTNEEINNLKDQIIKNKQNITDSNYRALLDIANVSSYDAMSKWEKILNEQKKNGDISNANTRSVNDKITEWLADLARKNEKSATNAQKMIDILKSFSYDSDVFTAISTFKGYITAGADGKKTILQENYDEIQTFLRDLYNKHKDAAKKIEQAKEQMQEALQQIHESIFPIDDDVDESIVAKLGEQFQLTAKKSELLDEALESNARKAKDVAEEVQRYNVALEKIIKNYATWQEALQSNSTADKLAVMPEIKDALADTLGISENVISNSFATTTKNLEDMRLALEGDKLAYERLQQATYNDILIHVGLNDAELNNIKTYLNNYFNNNPELDLNVPVGANLNRDGLDKVLAELIRRGIKTEEQLEAIFASWNVDLDVVIIDGVAQIHSYTKAATYELKEQEKSQEKLKDLERDRVKNQKELTKFLKDERDIYHEINRLLSDQERTIKRIARNQQNMYGTELLDNLNAESAEYEKQQKLLKSKQKLQQQDLANKKAALMSKGASFDVNGNISNYNNLISSAINNVNSIISRERGIQEAMNQHLLNGGSTSDEAYKDLDAQLSSIEREKNKANDYLNDLKTDLSNYEKVKDQAEDVADQLTELSEKQIEINLKKFNMKLEVTLDLSQATKTWNDYKRNVLQHDDIFNPNKTLSAQKDNTQRLADINADSRSLKQVNQQIAAAMADNGTLYKTQGQKKKAIEELQKKAIQLRKGILENEDAIKQTYLEQYDIISEMFEKQKSQYEFINNQLEHNKNMMKLVYGENNYIAQNVYNDKMIKNNLKLIESMNNRIQLAEQDLQKARKSGNTAIIEAAEKEWQTAIQNRNQLEEQSAQLMKDRYTAAINQIAHQMEQKLTNNKGFNYMDTEWDLIKKQSNLYLDNVNSAFAVKNTEYLYNQVLNDTKVLKNQQQLKKVMNEQLDILKEKDKLTQYDVDRAQKVLEVEKARIALEQARNNKTQMRLKRDSQGNYSYQYVADQDNIAKAENDLAKAENDLYNFDKENYEKSLEEAYNTTKEYQEKMKALNEEYITATEERRKQINEEIRLLEAQYSDYILNLSQETEWGKQNLMESTMINFSNMMNQEQLDFENMSDALKEKWLGDMVPSINSGIAEMISKFSTDPNSFKQIVVEATQAMDNERKTYQQGLAELQKAAGENWNNIKQAIDPVVELQNKLITDNDRLKDQAGEIVGAMNGTLDALKTQADKWQAVYDKTDAAVLRVYDYIKAIDEAALKKADEKNSKTVKDTTNKTIPTVNNLETYGNTAPGNTSSGGNKVESSSKEAKEDEIIAGYSTEVAKTVVSNIAGHNGRFSKEDIEKANKNTKLTLQDFYEAFPNMKMSEIQDLFTGKKQFSSLPKQTASEWYNFVRNYFSDKPAVLTQNYFIRAITGKYNSTESEAKEIFKKYKQYAGTQGGRYIKFDTGGYTGDWSSSQGKLAVLHQKELVLNKEDTANMLKMIAMVREMQQQELQFRLSSLNNEIQDVMKQNSQVEKIKSQQELLEQSVAITANFPSVNSKKEIEEALSELMNKATQIALKYKKN